MAGYSIYIYHITIDEANRVRRELGLPELKAEGRNRKARSRMRRMTRRLITAKHESGTQDVAVGEFGSWLVRIVKGDSPIFVGRKSGQSPERGLGQFPRQREGRTPANDNDTVILDWLEDGEEIEDEEKYWRKRLHHEEPVLEARADKIDGCTPGTKARSAVIQGRNDGGSPRWRTDPDRGPSKFGD